MLSFFRSCVLTWWCCEVHLKEDGDVDNSTEEQYPEGRTCRSEPSWDVGVGEFC